VHETIVLWKTKPAALCPMDLSRAAAFFFLSFFVLVLVLECVWFRSP
jgi:hypothetical protein